MTNHRSSVTATLVSVARGIGLSKTLRDPAASLFASSWVARVLDMFDRENTAIDVARLTARALSLGVIDHNTVRMLVIDEYIRQWVREGCSQVVILGAGLDSRAWRMPELNSAVVYEVDHSATQTFKAERTKRFAAKVVRPRLVPCDFMRQSVGATLARAGFRSDAKACWLCEGVTPYLPPEQTARLLHETAAISASGSRWAFSYIAPPDGSSATLGRRLIGTFVKRLGEPAVGAIERQQMANFAAAAGLLLLEDIGWSDWTSRVANYSSMPNLLRERLVVAGTPGVA
ncbi:MAG TPA: class I SAM-dependent methyltransferase [Polyangiaceae bacterium]